MQTITTHKGAYTVNRLNFGIKTAPLLVADDREARGGLQKLISVHPAIQSTQAMSHIISIKGIRDQKAKVFIIRISFTPRKAIELAFRLY